MTVEVGAEAPEFEMRATTGEMVKLSDFRGKKNVLLVFVPWAFTRICSSEMCMLRDDNADLVADERVEVLGISTDPVPILRKWKKDESFEHELLSDFWPHGTAAQAYGVFVPELGVAKRGTFLIDKQGIVRFAEASEINEVRDQNGWRAALDAIED